MDGSLPGSTVPGIPRQDTGVGSCRRLLQGSFPTQGLNPGLLHCRQSPALQADSLPTEPPRKSVIKVYRHIAFFIFFHCTLPQDSEYSPCSKQYDLVAYPSWIHCSASANPNLLIHLLPTGQPQGDSLSLCFIDRLTRILMCLCRPHAWMEA